MGRGGLWLRGAQKWPLVSLTDARARTPRRGAVFACPVSVTHSLI